LLERFNDITDLSCLWGNATTAIMNYISKNELVDSKYGWSFREGIVRKDIGKDAGYSLCVLSTAYDQTEKKQLFLSVEANVNFDDVISVHTVKRSKVDENLEKYL
jgi:hypothetical protein